jgi:Mg2+/Co2+ transporter CorB
LYRYSEDINRFLTTILIGSTCTSIGSAALATKAALVIWGEVGNCTLNSFDPS